MVLSGRAIRALEKCCASARLRPTCAAVAWGIKSNEISTKRADDLVWRGVHFGFPFH